MSSRLAPVVGGVASLFLLAACFRTYATPSVVGIVASETQAPSGVVVYTLVDGRKVTFDDSTQRAIGGPRPGDLLISVTGSNGFVLSAYPWSAQGWPQDCYLVPGRAWDLGDAVGIVTGTQPSATFRVPKAAHLNASIDPYGSDKTQYMGIAGVCLNAKGEATSVQ